MAGGEEGGGCGGGGGGLCAGQGWVSKFDQWMRRDSPLLRPFGCHLRSRTLHHPRTRRVVFEGHVVRCGAVFSCTDGFPRHACAGVCRRTARGRHASMWWFPAAHLLASPRCPCVAHARLHEAVQVRGEAAVAGHVCDAVRWRRKLPVPSRVPPAVRHPGPARRHSGCHHVVHGACGGCLPSVAACFPCRRRSPAAVASCRCTGLCGPLGWRGVGWAG